MGDKPLTAAQERFCIEVVKTSNQSEAYRIAFPLCKKWKREESVWQAGSKLAAEPKIRERISELKNQVITQPGIMAATEVLERLSDAGRLDPKEFQCAMAALKELLRHYQILSGFTPPPSPADEGNVVDDPANAHDWARRIAFALTQGAPKQIPPQPST